jgi:tetratricopeptide (TPR) repeat protein
MLAGWGRWDEAITDLTKARRQLRDAKSLGPQQLAIRDWFVAMAYVAREDHGAYQQVCREALNTLTTEPDRDARGRLLWLCTVTPDALDDPSRLAEFADSVLPANEASRTSEQLLNSGAALFRAGALPAARQRLEHAIHQISSGEKPVDPMTGVFVRLFLVMTYSRLGLAEQAEATLEEAIHAADNTRAPCWGDELQLIKLRAEAQALLSGSPGIDRSQ